MSRWWLAVHSALPGPAQLGAHLGADASLGVSRVTLGNSALWLPVGIPTTVVTYWYGSIVQIEYEYHPSIPGNPKCLDPKKSLRPFEQTRQKYSYGIK